ncbi:hypothetical protein D3C79_822580 [compost metagenome]
MQVAGEDPHQVTVLSAHLAVVALTADEGQLLSGFECADDAMAVGRAAAYIGAQAVTDPARIAGRLLGMHGGGESHQSGDQGAAQGREGEGGWAGFRHVGSSLHQEK